MRPFTMNHRQGSAPGLSTPLAAQVDLSFLLERPAEKDGFVTLHNGHLIKPNGARLRLWGVNITDWSRGSTMLPDKEDAAMYAATLARFGVNCVRLHFLDLFAPRGIVDGTREETQHFDPAQMDKLDGWMAALKQQGIYIDLNLAVGRTYKVGDEVQDYDQIGWAKAISYFDPRLIELQKAYAHRLLTHLNPYTGVKYRHEPAVVIVELVNENSLLDAWVNDRLHPASVVTRDPNFRPLTAHYDALLTRQYNDYITRHGEATLAQMRQLTGVAQEMPVPRLRANEFATAPAERFQMEAAFYMQVERDYFLEMRRYLQEELGVQSLLIGSSNYLHDQCNYASVCANSVLDIVDGHVYWQRPGSNEERNTAMVNNPAYSTVARLARSAVAGKPYIVSPYGKCWRADES